jgi:hypothetical protein
LRRGLDAVEDDVRDVWGAWIDAWAHDVRYGLKALLSKRAFLFTTVATLSLCVGANLAVFTIANALWLRPPTVRDPNRVVMLSGANDLSGTSEGFYLAKAGLETVRRLPVFDAVAGQVATSGNEAGNLAHITIAGRSDRATGQ